MTRAFVTRRTSSQRHPAVSAAAMLACEHLESRMLLTSTLYLDYGDRWAGGVLNTTAGAIDSTAAPGNPNIDGPRLSDPDGDDYAAAATVAITSLAMLNPANGAAIRAAMTALTQRFFEPFDITVVDLTADFQSVNGISVRAPADLTEASQLLGLNEGAGENNDTYLLIGGFLINGVDNPNGNFVDNGYGGLSTGTDINDDNDNDGTALVIIGGTGSATFDGPQNVHEAGHAFGQEHVYRQDTGNPPPAGFGVGYDMLHQSEVMSYLGYNTQGGFNFFSRFPVMDGDGNDDPDDLANGPTPYGDMVDDPNIGPSSIEYVTGSGANDIITITKTGATTANVSLQSFTDAAYTSAIDFPGATGTTYSYSINTDRPLTIDAGGRNDRIVLDGDLGTTITLRGMHGTDELIVMGKDAASAVYTTGTNSADGLDGNDDLRGSIVIGATTINFQEFENASNVTIQDVAALTYRTGGSDDDLTLDSPSAGRMRLDGDTDNVNLVPVEFFNVGALTIDTATNDGAVASDNVTIAANAVASGLNSIGVNTGAGDDFLHVNFTLANAIPAGGLSFDGGGGANDLLRLTGGSFTNATYAATGPSSGTIALDSTNMTYSNLAPIEDTTNAVNLNFSTTNVANQIDLFDGPLVNGFNTTLIASGNATFERLSFANKTNVTINGAGGDDIISSFASFNTPGLTTLRLNGDGGDDLFQLAASPVLPITIDGGAHTTVDTIRLNGNIADTTVAAATLTTDGAFPVSYLDVETLVLHAGTFNLPGAITANIVVDFLGTLYGDGSTTGTLSAEDFGRIEPGPTLGDSTAVLDVGGLDLNAGSTYAVNLNGTTPAIDHDQLNVAGTVDLGLGVATLSATVGYGSIPGDEIVIIRNDGTDAVAGFFAGAPQGAIFDFGGGQRFTIDYAFDADGSGLAFNDVALIRYGAQLAPDPCDPSKTALFVSATAATDEIVVAGVPGNAGGRVLINGVDEGVFQWDGYLYVMGQNGDDTINVTMPSRNAFLYGQTGNDSLTAGNSDSILIGGFGDDLLQAGNGKDILIGGVGADEIRAANGTDILIAGATTYDAVSAANRHTLCHAAEAWKTGGKPDSVATVFTAATLINDNDVDQLLGDHGDDWHILNSTGAGVLDLTDADGKELVTDLI